ncbi:hypothetical protein SQH80_11530 [Enterococcus faecium]|uniref:hypothetical protein n=1 Tax=Enterococcus TaxID=1350 RepID=UPI000933C4AC|nr:MULTISPECIES: hypothetical protein [Enterococcus]EGP4777033.1 hypothetical protein [Enterococcus faecium]EGP5233527.1 hypothetical protein [Enterococcus faecium]EME8208458.1 hypothetical protein [Enterococcus faecium]EMF0369915.1 hypothetical protein [Enterococcus faecium]MBX4252290.1 hypothetical protein [Enterococcus faecium]
MGLLKLISNRISTEWKEKFNKNIDYLNDLEKKLSDQDKSTNSRIDNLVLHSGGDSPNEVVDGRVDYKGQTYNVLQDRLLASERLFRNEIDEVQNQQQNTQNQVGQLNDSIEQIIGGSAAQINIYVSVDKGNDQTGDGSEEKPFATIQMAFNQVALITIPSVTIWIDSGVYLEDPVLRNVSVTALYIRCKDNVDSIDASTADLPVKVRSVGFFFVRGYIQVTGLQFIDTANGPDFSGSIYQLLAEQSGYVAVNKCKFANDNRNSSSMAVYAGGTTQCHIYGNTYFYRQNIAIWAKLMGTILISSIIGSQNTTGARCDDGVIRREPPTGFADIQTKVTGCGLYITKGTTL